MAICRRRLYLAATTALQGGKVERAAGYVERLRRIAPDAPVSMRIEGDLAMAQKRYTDAVGYYDKALAGGGTRCWSPHGIARAAWLA